MEHADKAPQYKIALVSDWYYPRVGGVEYVINALARYLLQLGHQVHIITKKIPGTTNASQDGGLLIIRLVGNRISEHLMSRKTYHALTKQLIEGDYDIVHAHGIDSPMALASLMIARHQNKIALMTNHSEIGCDSLKLPKTLLLRFFLKYAHALISVSAAVSLETQRLFSGPLHIIPNGVDDYSPNGALVQHHIPEDKTVITTVARMVIRKGVNDFIDLALILLRTRNNLFFILVGDGPLRCRLEKKVSSAGLAKHFLFIGSASRATTLALLEKTTLFVSTSTKEAFGIAILEAFYKNVPVVAREGTGAAALIKHNQTGFLAKNQSDFIKIIESLIDEPGRREFFASSVYNCLADYQWINIAQNMASIYTELRESNRVVSC